VIGGAAVDGACAGRGRHALAQLDVHDARDEVVEEVERHREEERARHPHEDVEHDRQRADDDEAMAAAAAVGEDERGHRHDGRDREASRDPLEQRGHDAAVDDLLDEAGGEAHEDHRGRDRRPSPGAPREGAAARRRE
jgi:hypothetical protein